MKSLNNYILEKLKLTKTSGKSDYVDLELPSGTLWCKYNVGVDPNKLETPEDWYGDYFKWGEIEKSVDANINDYSWWKANEPDKKFAAVNFIKYNDKDKLDELEIEDDAAHNWNALCVMPTKEQFEELVANTEFEVFAPGSFGECYKGIEGLYGQLFKGKNGNELFIPYNGCVLEKGKYDYQGKNTYLWCRNKKISETECAYLFQYKKVHDAVRSTCYGVRGVRQ